MFKRFCCICLWIGILSGTAYSWTAPNLQPETIQTGQARTICIDGWE